MKKEYTTPTMKVWEMNPDSMLCTSDITTGSRFNSPYYDYIEGGGSEGGFTPGIPD